MTAPVLDLGYIQTMVSSVRFPALSARFCLRLTLRHAMWAALFLIAASANDLFAQQTEVITLKHRAASEVIGVIRPLVEPAGSVSAMQDQLIVRTTAANLVQVKKVVAAIDREPRRLLISVRQDGSSSGAAQGRVDSTRTLNSGQSMQRIQVLEGGKAFIETGSTVPVSNPALVATPRGIGVADNVSVRELATGFAVSAMLAGDRVTLEISARRAVPAGIAGGAGSAESQTVMSTVSGRLGEWILIGGAGQAAGGEPAAGPQSWRTSSGERGVLLKVEELH